MKYANADKLETYASAYDSAKRLTAALLELPVFDSAGRLTSFRSTLPWHFEQWAQTVLASQPTAHKPD